MKKTFRMAAAALAIAAVTLGCSAQADQTTDKLKATLQTRLSDVTIKSVTKSPIAGLYEVNLGTQIVYSDANGDYLMLGDLVDAKTRKNLTEARLAETNRIDFASLPFGNAVKVVR
ncbi:disulfide isomerase DsbC N-terminal domain-containing protein, partial [Paraburkholderia sp.]|uniref:disulfide isomerase DsbC N-terminal domain-containing protein n=1 Tax=Paraburkholderia sp. TaxID=1926495 RepID=UPI002F3ECFC5